MQREFKFIEVAINKFYDEAIPHHRHCLKMHKINTHQLATSGNIAQLNKEVTIKKRVIKQLKDLLFELDTLRTQVADAHLNQFDCKTFALRKTIAGMIVEYNAIEKQALTMAEMENSINERIENEDPFGNLMLQLEIDGNVDEMRLQDAHQRLNSIVAIENDIEDLHDMCVDLHGMVHEQAEGVRRVESNVDEAHGEVDQGLQQLVIATRLKRVSYPLTGALVGSLLGGPLGMFAGFKIGGAAAVGCGIIGYASGKLLKDCHCGNETQRNVVGGDNVEEEGNKKQQ